MCGEKKKNTHNKQKEYDSEHGMMNRYHQQNNHPPMALIGY